jgi:hypothetical protein
MNRRWLVVAISMVILFVLLDLFLAGREGHVESPWSGIIGFFLLFGFFGCLALIVVAKLLGHHWLQRREEYYDRDDEDE